MLACSVNPLHLIKFPINPKGDFVFRLMVCVNVRADQVVFFVCTTAGKRQNVMNIPATIDTFTKVVDIIIFFAISITTHKISVKILCKLSVAKKLFPQMKCSCSAYFHTITSQPRSKIKKSIHYCVYRLQ